MLSINRSMVVLGLLMGLGACSGVTQALGDSGGGAGSGGAVSAGGSLSSAGGQAAGGTVHAGGSGGRAAATGTAGSSGTLGLCGAGCASGYDCFPSEDRSHGVCAPLCDSQEQAAWGQPCANSVSGGPGICRPFLKWSSAYGSGQNSGGQFNVLVPTGVCTQECDPLVSTACPAEFSCDVTEVAAGAMPDKTFACLPLVEAPPLVAGSVCNDQPVGECSVGSSCILADNDGHCRAFCDLNGAGSCPSPQTCTKPDYFPPASSAGVCKE